MRARRLSFAAMLAVGCLFAALPLSGCGPTANNNGGRGSGTTCSPSCSGTTPTCDKTGATPKCVCTSTSCGSGMTCVSGACQTSGNQQGDGLVGSSCNVQGSCPSGQDCVMATSQGNYECVDPNSSTGAPAGAATCTQSQPCASGSSCLHSSTATSGTCFQDCQGSSTGCQSGYDCFDLYQGYCSKNCMADADCGTGNVCLNAGGLCADGKTQCSTDADCGSNTPCSPAGVCLKGCDTSVQAGACRNGYLCVASSGGGTQGMCYPDCRTDSTICQQGETCDQSTGQCQAAPGTQQAYQECGTQATGNCVAGDDCVGTGSGADRCLQQCTSDTDCTAVAGSKCAVQAQNGNTKWCVVECTPGGTANTCPSGSTCQSVTGGGLCF